MSADGTEGDDIAEQLKVLRAKRAELAAAREAKEAQQALELELVAEQRALRDEQALTDAIDKYGAVDRAIATVETDMGLVIVRRASAIKFRRFQDKEEYSTDDVLSLVRPCLVHPSAPDLDAMLEEQPALITRLGSAVARLAGVRTKELAKK